MNVQYVTYILEHQGNAISEPSQLVANVFTWTLVLDNLRGRGTFWSTFMAAGDNVLINTSSYKIYGYRNTFKYEISTSGNMDSPIGAECGFPTSLNTHGVLVTSGVVYITRLAIGNDRWTFNCTFRSTCKISLWNTSYIICCI